MAADGNDREVGASHGGFDPRVVGPRELSFLQAVQRVAPFHLGGGAALAGVHLRHRLSADADLFVHERGAHRDLVRALPDVGAANGTPVSILRDGGSFVRARLQLSNGVTELDVVYDPVPDLEPAPPPVDGIVVESLVDLRANKLTCILSRSEPRDLVDLLFLDRLGYAPERDVQLALRKDAGIDPGVIAWLLGQFPVEPLPVMLMPLGVVELRAFRDDLRERFRRLAVPPATAE
ncbi:MAG: nucleotidyl transferase AbiEii/AbiGii toxin family protein [Acidobacteria bacterium]|nr:nucleotidyl transferase AbiEii/AbiGii toxin family protein [Acidobacteriota bacterium]